VVVARQGRFGQQVHHHIAMVVLPFTSRFGLFF
jgi:hypothetical protein